jgi:hypothetical protein
MKTHLTNYLENFANNFKSRIWYVIAFLLLIIYFASFKQDTVTNSSPGAVPAPSQPITSSTGVNWVTSFDHNSPKTISMQFGTYGRQNTSKYTFTMSNEDGKVLYTKTIDSGTLQDNGFYNFDIKSAKIKANVPLQLSLQTSEESPDNAIAVYILPKKGSTLTQGNQFADTTVQFVTNYGKVFSKTFIAIRVLMLIIFALLVLSFRTSAYIAVFDFVFKYRWFIGIGLLAFVSIFELHGSSISTMNNYITSAGNHFSKPIFGVARAIRSDEWMVGTPIKLWAVMNGNISPLYNITDHSFLKLAYDYFATLGNAPFSLGLNILGVNHGFPIYWYSAVFLGFLSFIEFFMIITNKNKLFSVAGACLITFSAWYQWWTMPTLIVYAVTAIVCFYHYICASNYYKKILLALALSLSTSCFVTNLYPAWQVPLGFICLGFIIWITVDKFDLVKKFNIKDYLIIFVALAFCMGLIAAYLLDIRQYMQVISQTVYPGARRSNGAYVLNKVYDYFATPLFAYRHVDNPSEMGTFFTLFPAPMLMAGFIWFKSKRKDLLLTIIMILSLFLLFYCWTGLPSVLAKYTLMQNSTPLRAVDIFGFIQIVLLIIVFARNKEEIKLNKVFAALLAVGVAGYTCYRNVKGLTYWSNGVPFTKYASTVYIVIMTVTICFLIFAMSAKVHKVILNIASTVLILISIITGIYVNPVMKSMDAVYSKPIAQKIMAIDKSDKNAVWVANGMMFSNFAAACGANVVNKTELYPDLDMWHKLDPKGQYEEVYNRYCHITLAFVDAETTISLATQDTVSLSLSFDDLSKLGITYILWPGTLTVPERYTNDIKQIYQDGNMVVYHVNNSK